VGWVIISLSFFGSYATCLVNGCAIFSYSRCAAIFFTFAGFGAFSMIWGEIALTHNPIILRALTQLSSNFVQVQLREHPVSIGFV
jgi:hypothetical protein